MPLSAAGSPKDLDVRKLEKRIHSKLSSLAHESFIKQINLCQKYSSLTSWATNFCSLKQNAFPHLGCLPILLYLALTYNTSFMLLLLCYVDMIFHALSILSSWSICAKPPFPVSLAKPQCLRLLFG